jgi:hypothetical protein
MLDGLRSCCLLGYVQARLLCLSLGECFCPTDREGQAAARKLLSDAPRGDKLQALAAELVEAALASGDAVEGRAEVAVAAGELEEAEPGTQRSFSQRAAEPAVTATHLELPLGM